MARFLLDTNILSYLIKATYPALDHHFRHTPKRDVMTSSICEGELRFGLALLPSEAKIIATAERFLHDIEIDPWDTKCAKRFATLAALQRKREKPLSEADTMIAAHALARDLTLVTNDKAFARVKGLRVEDWTKGPRPA